MLPLYLGVYPSGMSLKGVSVHHLLSVSPDQFHTHSGNEPEVKVPRENAVDHIVDDLQGKPEYQTSGFPV